MAANRFGIDVASLQKDRTSIEGAQTTNKMNSLALKETEREIAQRPTKEAEALKRKNTLSEVRGKASTGDDAAQRRLLAIDPENGPAFISAVSKMDESQIEKTKQSIEDIGRMSATVLNAKPERQAALYDQMLNMLPEATKAKLPETFDANFMELSRAKAASMDKILENPKLIKVGSEDVLYNQGQEIGRETSAAKAPLVSVNTAGDKKEGEKLAELRVGKLGKMQDEAIAAENQIESINQIKAIDLDTGFGVETRGQIAKVWSSLGGDGEALTGVDPSDVEKFKAVATKQVLDIMASQKGPQTDQDAARIEKATSNLGNTREANQFVMDATIAIANRKIEQSAFYEMALEETGTLKGADAAWRDFKAKTPMVSDVVKDPETGVPVFFYQFRDKMAQRNYENKDIVEAWRRMNAGGN